MFLSNYKQLKPGDRDIGLIVGDQKFLSQPFLVLRVATRDEWLREERELCPHQTLRQLEQYADQNPYFYEISVD